MALAELTLAHRRLSTKLDLTEQALKSTQLELASCTQENTRLGKEREGDRAIINELRRGEEERMEELEWERGERRKAEELKRLWYVPYSSPARSPQIRAATSGRLPLASARAVDCGSHVSELTL